MDKLQRLVQVMSEKMLVEFTAFVQKAKMQNNRKDLLLLQLLVEGNCKSAKEYTQALYGKHALNNYQTLRKRLNKQITLFFAQNYMEEDQSSASMVFGFIATARFLLDQNEYTLAWSFLIKAEKLAIKGAHYDLLNIVYNLQVENADQEAAIPLEKIIQNKNEYREKADQQEKYVLVCALVKQKLHKMRFSEEPVDLNRLVKGLFERYKVDISFETDVKSVYYLLTIARSAAVANKDFAAFEPFILEQYHRLEKARAFHKSNHLYKLHILFLLSHTLYRTKKFNSSLEFQSVLFQELEVYPQLYKNRFYHKLTMLHAAANVFCGESGKAVQVLEQLLLDKPAPEEEDRLNILLNLGFYYFIQGELHRANQVNYRLGHTDKWCEKKMGKEWVMKKNLMEIIIQFELTNFEIALLRIESFKKQYKYFVDRPIYDRVMPYVDFIKKSITKPQLVKSAGYKKEVVGQLTQVPLEKEDLQAMGFYSWLKSKMNNTSFFEALIDTVQ